MKSFHIKEIPPIAPRRRLLQGMVAGALAGTTGVFAAEGGGAQDNRGDRKSA